MLACYTCCHAKWYNTDIQGCFEIPVLLVKDHFSKTYLFLISTFENFLNINENMSISYSLETSQVVELSQKIGNNITIIIILA